MFVPGDLKIKIIIICFALIGIIMCKKNIEYRHVGAPISAIAYWASDLGATHIARRTSGLGNLHHLNFF